MNLKGHCHFTESFAS